MASTRRERELARLRAERQAARRAEEARRRRQRLATISSVVAVLVVVGVVLAITLANRGGSSTTASPKATPSATPAANGPCGYTKAGTASRQVTLPPSTPDITTTQLATMVTDQGTIAFTLDGAKAPCASSAIVSLAKQKFYDGTPCHRLTSGGLSVLQCGDPTGTGSGGPGYQYKEENLTGATYTRGTVAMAKTSATSTTGSQFFLVYQDSQLPPQYTPVGKITTGLDVLDKVAAAGEDPAGDGKPKLPVTITTFTTAPDPSAASSAPASPTPAPSAS